MACNSNSNESSSVLEDMDSGPTTTISDERVVRGEVVSRRLTSIRYEDKVFPKDSTLFKVVDKRGEYHFFVIPSSQLWNIKKGQKVEVSYNKVNAVVAIKYEAVPNSDGSTTIKKVLWMRVHEVKIFSPSVPKTIIVSRESK